MATARRFSLKNKNIFVAGETGLVGKALFRALERHGLRYLSCPHGQLDLMEASGVEAWLQENRPDVIIMAAGRVGGIGANAADPVGFYRDNWIMAQNIIYGAARHNVQKLLYLGSSCIYPRLASQPITERALLKGRLEKTNQGYALAKIKAIKLCQFYYRQGYDFISVMPTNLYGSGDRYNLQKSHVIPALIQKISRAKMMNEEQVVLWGTGTPLREFLYVDDLAEACLHVLRYYSSERPLNIGSGREETIRDLAAMIARMVDYQGEIIFDSSMPDGTPRKALDSTHVTALGWGARITLEEGLRRSWEDYQRKV